MTKATVKFQLPNGFGVVELKSGKELTFVDRTCTYRSGSKVFAQPFFRKKKLVCSVFQPNTEKYRAVVVLPNYKPWGWVQFQIGTPFVRNGYVCTPKTALIELRNCNVRKVYPQGEDLDWKLMADMYHVPTNFKFQAQIYYSADHHNKQGRVTVENLQSQIELEKKIIEKNWDFEKVRHAYGRALIREYEALIPRMMDDYDLNLLMYGETEVKIHSSEFSPKYNNLWKTYQEHTHRENLRELLGE